MLQELMNRVRKVHESCQTLEQQVVALKYGKLATIKLRRFDMVWSSLAMEAFNYHCAAVKYKQIKEERNVPVNEQTR